MWHWHSIRSFFEERIAIICIPNIMRMLAPNWVLMLIKLSRWLVSFVPLRSIKMAIDGLCDAWAATRGKAKQKLITGVLESVLCLLIIWEWWWCAAKSRTKSVPPPPQWKLSGRLRASLCICKCKETIACHKKISKVRKHVTLVNRNDSIDYERKCYI